MAQFQILVPDAKGVMVGQDGYFDDGLTARPGEAAWSTDAVEAHCKTRGKGTTFAYVCTPNWEAPPLFSGADVAVLADLAVWEMTDPHSLNLFKAHTALRAEFAALEAVADAPTKAKLKRVLAARLASLSPEPDVTA